MKDKIVQLISNCNDEKKKAKLIRRVAHRYCAINGIYNRYDETTGKIIKAIIPSLETMLNNLNGEDCAVILRSRTFRNKLNISKDEVEEMILDCECSECEWECAGEDCPILQRQINDDISVLELIDSCIKDEEEEMDSGIEDEDTGYMGEPGFSSSGDYWNYILG